MDYLGMTARYTRRGETSRLEIRETEKLSPHRRPGRTKYCLIEDLDVHSIASTEIRM